MGRRRRRSAVGNAARGAASTRVVRLTICALALAVVASSATTAAAGASPTRARLAGPSATFASGVGSSWSSLASPRVLARASLARRRARAARIAVPALGLGGGEIEGKVTSAATKTAIASVEVCAFEVEEPFAEECATTSGSGEYVLAGLPPGDYDVAFYAPSEAGLNYQTQFYEGKTTEAEANPVAVAEGAVVPGIDAAMLPGGEISGVVTSATTKAGLPEVLVCARVGQVGACAITGADGAYTLAGLPTDSYLVAFFAPEEAGSSYVPQFFDDKASAAEANPVSVTVGLTTSSIDAALEPGVPEARSRPALLGSLVAGQTLTAIHASWTNNPTSIVDVWGRCNSAGAICFVAGTGPSYTLTPSDAGHTFFFKETAFGAAGASEPAFSPLSAIVAPAPPSSGPAPPAPTPAPASGVLSSTSTKASAAQLRSLLERLLVPSGRNSKIAQLLKHKGYSLSFTALSAGKLTISWFLVPKGAHVASAKPVLAASGSVSSPAPGGAKLTIKLTARGRGLLAHASRMKLTGKGVLAPSGQSALSATRAFIVSR